MRRGDCTQLASSLSVRRGEVTYKWPPHVVLVCGFLASLLKKMHKGTCSSLVLHSAGWGLSHAHTFATVDARHAHIDGALSAWCRCGAQATLMLTAAAFRIAQVCRGLSALHAKKFIHRDVKPTNIFLCEHKFIKIGDLGVAKTLQHDIFTSTQIGTPAYMAPEVWARLKYTYSSDLYSLGCILYEMMTYKLPYLARTIEDMCKVGAMEWVLYGGGGQRRVVEVYLAGMCHHDGRTRTLMLLPGLVCMIREGANMWMPGRERSDRCLRSYSHSCF